MSKAPPQIIDPVKAAEKGRIVEGVFPVTRMARLGGMTSETSGEVHFSVQFGREGGFCTARGSLVAELALECQCCLSPLTHSVDVTFALGVVSSLEEGKSLPESLEPLLLREGTSLSIIELIEDELLLSIPYVPQHPVCPTRGVPLPVEFGTATARKPAFADLSSLIKSNNQARSG